MSAAPEVSGQVTVVTAAVHFDTQGNADMVNLTEDVRRLGMCRSEGLAIPGWSGIAMPIEGIEGRMFAISLGLRTELLDSELKIQQAGLSLAATASRVATSFKSAQRATPHAPAKPGPTELRRPSGP